jgi:hypothetical protein
MALIGTLNDFGLSDLIQLIDLGRKTGVVAIFAAGDDQVAGHLYFHEGSLHHANLDGLPGEEAAYHLMSVERGTYAFIETTDLPPRTIWSSNEQVIMESIFREEPI